MTQPSITAISNGDATTAATVHNNDTALANAFGNLDTTDNIADNMALCTTSFQVAVGHMDQAASSVLFWRAPFALDLERIDVIPLKAANWVGGYADDYGNLDGSNSVAVALQSSTTFTGTYTTIQSVTINSSARRTTDFDADDNVTAGHYLRILCTETGTPAGFFRVVITATTSHLTKATEAVT